MRAFLFILWWTALIVLITLKASGAALSWWIVLAPIYEIPVVALVLLILMVMVVVFLELGLGPKPNSPKL